MLENAKRSRAEAACQEVIIGWPKEDNRDGIWAGSYQRHRFVMWMLEQAKLLPPPEYSFMMPKMSHQVHPGVLSPNIIVTFGQDWKRKQFDKWFTEQYGKRQWGNLHYHDGAQNTTHMIQCRPQTATWDRMKSKPLKTVTAAIGKEEEQGETPRGYGSRCDSAMER